jgi:hypothetical protein
MLFTMKSFAALAFVAVSLPLAAQQQPEPVPYSITCYTPQNCTATPKPGVTVVYDNRPKLSDALATLQQQLAQQAQLRAQQEQARAASVNAKAISDANDKLMADIEKILDSPKPKPPPAFTTGFANGRLWVQMDETNKLVYVMALSEGRIALKDKLALDERATFDSVVKWLDWFYSTPGYIAVPVVWAHSFFMQRTPPEAMKTSIDNYLIGLTLNGR